ncbi:hypothetical protein HY745_11520 [Candidatus Desantisbacteria bacterium]|nr:hypothetical protein [Candidatus Desantisbacteria bacterium]
MRYKWGIIILLIVVYPIHAKKKKKIWQGTLEYSNYNYMKNKDLKDSPRLWNELKFYPKIEYYPYDYLKLNIEFDIRKNFELNERNNSGFKELWFEIEYEIWSVKIGKQIIEWGRTDTIKPGNVFNVKDVTDLIEGIDTGIPALKYAHYFGMHELEIVWVPVFIEDRLPYSEKNRWFFLPSTGDVIIDKSEMPEKDLKSPEIGTRFSFLGNGLDFAITAAKMYDRMPTYFLNKIENISPLVIRIYPYYRSIYTLGMDGAFNMFQCGLRSELAYIFTEDMKSKKDEIDDPYVQWVSGIDRTFGRVYRDWVLVLLAQYALDKELPVRGEENQDESYAKLKHFYRQAGLVNAEIKFSEFNKFSIKSFQNLEKQDYLYQVEYIYKPQDTVEIKIGGDLPGGRKNGFFGYFDKNDRVRAGVKCYF